MTQYTSDLQFPGGGTRGTADIEVGEHAVLPDLEPNWLSIKRDNTPDEQLIFHKKEDFEAFLANLFKAAEDAYDEPLDVDFPVGDGTYVVPIPVATLQNWEARLTSSLGKLALLERALENQRHESLTVIVNVEEPERPFTESGKLYEQSRYAG